MASNPIDIWYGPKQRFSHLGHPYRWVNVLVSVARPEHVVELDDSLNVDQERPLALGLRSAPPCSPGQFQRGTLVG